MAVPRSSRWRSPLARLMALTVCAAALAGCARAGDAPAGPAVPAQAPAQAAGLAGVTPTGPLDFLAADLETGTVAGTGGTRTDITLYGTASPRTVRLSVPVAGLAAGKPGEILAPARDRIFRIDVRAATAAELPVAGEVRAAVYRPDGTVAVALAGGAVRIIRPDGTVAQTITSPAAPDVLAPAGAALLALDRARSAVTALNPATGTAGATLGAGEGAGMMLAGGAERVFATDTRGGALLVFSAARLVLRQRFPVGSSPYALAYDPRTGLVWVTLTASNEVAAYDVSAGIPKEVRRHATVRQPNSVTVNGRAGGVFVGSASGDGLQQIGER